MIAKSEKKDENRNLKLENRRYQHNNKVVNKIGGNLYRENFSLNHMMMTKQQQ